MESGREGPKVLDLDRDARTVRITYIDEPIVEDWGVSEVLQPADD
jgi:hypothetical protein